MVKRKKVSDVEFLASACIAKIAFATTKVNRFALIARASGNFKQRREIRLNDRELEEYLKGERASALSMAVTAAICFEYLRLIDRHPLLSLWKRIVKKKGYAKQFEEISADLMKHLELHGSAISVSKQETDERRRPT